MLPSLESFIAFIFTISTAAYFAALVAFCLPIILAWAVWSTLDRIKGRWPWFPQLILYLVAIFPLIVAVILIYADKSISAMKQPQPAAASVPASQVTNTYVRKVSPSEANSINASIEAVLGQPTNSAQGHAMKPAQRIDIARPATSSTPDRIILEPVQPIQLDLWH